jgi:hypothetical protein
MYGTQAQRWGHKARLICQEKQTGFCNVHGVVLRYGGPSLLRRGVVGICLGFRAARPATAEGAQARGQEIYLCLGEINNLFVLLLPSSWQDGWERMGMGTGRSWAYLPAIREQPGAGWRQRRLQDPAEPSRGRKQLHAAEIMSNQPAEGYGFMVKMDEERESGTETQWVGGDGAAEQKQ